MCKRTDHKHWCITCKREIPSIDVKIHEKAGCEVDRYCMGEEKEVKGKDENVQL